MDAPSAKGLVLDFGGVVTRSFFETRQAFERLLALPDNAFSWHGPFAAEADDLWSGVRTGELTESAYWTRRAREAGAAVGECWTMQDFCRRHNELPVQVVVRPEVMRLVADARRQGVRLAVLTNVLEAMNGKAWVETSPIIRMFDALVDASRTGIRKPDPQAYHLAVQALGLEASDAVFIDDQIVNVDGARAAGIEAFHLDITRPVLAFDGARARLGLSR
jgi:putative hydrolase of the HAD superfamily